VPVAQGGEHFPTEVSYDAKLQSDQDPGEDNEHADELTVCAEIIWLCIPHFHQQSRWMVSDNPAGEEAGCGGPGLTWLHVICVVRSVGRTSKFSKMMLKATYGREINNQLSGNNSAGLSCSQHANCMLPQNSGLLLSPSQGTPV
jgi:hypothetical protein